MMQIITIDPLMHRKIIDAYDASNIVLTHMERSDSYNLNDRVFEGVIRIQIRKISNDDNALYSEYTPIDYSKI